MTFLKYRRLMALSSFNKSPTRHNVLRRFCSEAASYEMPQRYRDSFYLANSSLYDMVNWYLHRAYEVFFPTMVNILKDLKPDLDQEKCATKVRNIIQMLDQCNSIVDVRFPVMRETGKLEIVRGFQANYGMQSGFAPCLGGLRIHQEITRDQMKGLSVLATYRLACSGIKMSGASAGLKIDPKLYTEDELTTIIGSYVDQLSNRGFLGPNVTVLAPDVNSNAKEMSMMANHFAENKDFYNYFVDSSTSKAVTVGKNASDGGFEGFDKSGSQGIYFAIEKFLNDETLMKKVQLSKGVEGKTFIIQGVGKMGGTLAKYLERRGAVCVGIKEHDAYIEDEKGLDVDEILECIEKNGSIKPLSLSKHYTHYELFKKPCDLLILCACQKSVGCYLAKDIYAKVVVEGAYGAVTPSTQKILEGRSRLVIPDIYACAGSAIVGYLEYCRCAGLDKMEISPFFRNILSMIATEYELQHQMVSGSVIKVIEDCSMEHEVLPYAIEHILSDKAERIMEIVKEFKLNLDIRSGAYILSILHIFESILKKEI